MGVTSTGSQAIGVYAQYISSHPVDLADVADTGAGGDGSAYLGGLEDVLDSLRDLGADAIALHYTNCVTALGCCALALTW